MTNDERLERILKAPNQSIFDDKGNIIGTTHELITILKNAFNRIVKYAEDSHDLVMKFSEELDKL